MKLLKLLRDVRGASAIEYALVASLIAVAAVVGITNLGTKMNGMYSGVDNKLG